MLSEPCNNNLLLVANRKVVKVMKSLECSKRKGLWVGDSSSKSIKKGSRSWKFYENRCPED